ncbi:terminase small subunit [Arcobacter arenosus]|uniref:terminase small subunit n=1 Tax=Arcobacter arenosus TaxID=2576037 RepID=UPI003BA8BE7E
MSNLTAKQIKFCENYILTRDIKQSSLNAGYSQSYSKSKAYELLQDERIQKKIHTLETEHNQNHFKRLSMIANTELENILIGSDNDNAKLRAIELVYKLSGVIKDEKISLNINNSNQNQVLTIDDIYKTKTLDDFYEDEVKNIVADTLEEFEKNY